jgi:hypothetical protein
MPFTVEQFLDVFGKYNLAIWPRQLLFYLIVILTLILAVKKTNYSDKVISAILSFFWLWMGVVYHLLYFTQINKAAYAFGILYIIQGILFFYVGIMKNNLSFRFQSNNYTLMGSLFVIYGVGLYPILGYFLGHIYPKSPTFGLPCPTTIFTFGLLLWTEKAFPKYLLLIPFIWSVIGFSAAVSLGIREDIGVLIAGLVSSLLILFRDRSKTKEKN